MRNVVTRDVKLGDEGGWILIQPDPTYTKEIATDIDKLAFIANWSRPSSNILALNNMMARAGVKLI